jgi:biopolymer transport protein ExbB/biopolymer transport protein TolQ
MEGSLLELWAAMGWFARAVVFVLLLMSVLAAAVAIRKTAQFHRARKTTLLFSPLFSDALARNELPEARELIEQHTRSHLAFTFQRVLDDLIADGVRTGNPGVDVAGAERTMELNSLEQLAGFRRGLGVLATTGSTAPFVGLLGTVVGVVNAFQGMAVSGSGGLSAISQGIAEALVATAIGLLVAIPAVWLYNYFVNRIELISMEIMHGSKQLIDYLLRYDSRVEPQAIAEASS